MCLSIFSVIVAQEPDFIISGFKMSAKDTESIIGRTSSFYSDSIAELKKVHTPSRSEATQATLVTVFIMVFVSICLFLADLFFGWLMGRLLP